MQIGVLELQDDVSAAQWVVDLIHPLGRDVGSLVPEGFAAYARIFHPAAFLMPGEERAVGWAAMAAAQGRETHPEMQFPNLTDAWPHRGHSPQSLWNQEPDEGCLPRDIAARLTQLLAPFTKSPARCWFCVWDGFGGSKLPYENQHKVALPQRSYHLLNGPIEGINETYFEPVFVGDSRSSRKLKSPWFRRRRRRGWFRHGPARRTDAGWRGFDQIPIQDLPTWQPWQSVNLWWPDDRAWFVATEIDLMSTYVGGARACIDALLAAPQLEVMEAEVGHGIDYASDRLNPRPQEPW